MSAALRRSDNSDIVIWDWGIPNLRGPEKVTRSRKSQVLKAESHQTPPHLRPSVTRKTPQKLAVGDSLMRDATAPIWHAGNISKLVCCAAGAQKHYSIDRIWNWLKPQLYHSFLLCNAGSKDMVVRQHRNMRNTTWAMKTWQVKAQNIQVKSGQEAGNELNRKCLLN